MKINDIEIGKTSIKDIFDIQKYLDDFINLKHEEMVVFGFDNNCTFTLAEFITTYSESDKAQFNMNYMFKRLKETKSKGFILVHNHPTGICIPTEIDVETTKDIMKEAEKKKLLFMEHYTWTKGLLWSIINTSIKNGLYIKKEDLSERY